MEVKATHKHARMAPRKIRPLARLMRGMAVQEAINALRFMPGKAPVIVADVLRSAVANSLHNFGLAEDSLTVQQVIVDEGLVMKRFNPVSRGMAHPILKRTSHVTVVVAGEAAEKKPKKASKKEAAKADIATVSVGEYEEQRVKMREEEEQELAAAPELPKKKVEDEKLTVSERQDKENYEARQQKRMIQQGGDKNKGARRVSKKEGK